jgi:CBS domain-containing protein
MHVQEIMKRNVLTCMRDHTIECAAQIMWENDCGIVPIVDEASRVIGVVTDRDACMAAYTQGKPLSEIPIWSVIAGHSGRVHTCRAEDTLEQAEHVMQQAQVRRLPVIDDRGTLVGILSLSDIARHTSTRGLDPFDISRTVEALSQPHPHSRALAAHGSDGLATT